MKPTLLESTGSALVWKAVQLAGLKIIFLARLLVLAWLLSPEDFGLFAMSVVVIDFLLSVTNPGVDQALVQQTDAEDRHYHAAWTIGIVRAVVVGAMVFAAAPLLAQLFAEPRAVNLIRVLAFRPLIDALASMRVMALVRDLRFRTITLVRLPEALINTIASIAFAPIAGVWALVIGPIAGSLLYAAISYVVAPYRPRFELDRAAVTPLASYGQWIFIRGVLAVTANLLLHVIVSRQLGAASLGLYFLAARLAFLPSEVASEVAGSVAFPVYGRLKHDLAAAARAFRSFLTGLAALLVPAALLIIVLAPSLVEDALGPRWDGTVRLIQILAAVNVVGLLGDAAVPLFKGLGQPRKIAILGLIQTVLIVGFLWDFSRRFGLIGAGLAWLPTIAIVQVACVVFLGRSLVRPFAGLGPPAFAISVAALAGAAAAWSIDTLVPDLFGVFLAGVAAALVTGTLLLRLDRLLNLGITGDLTRVFPRLAVLLRTPEPAR